MECSGVTFTPSKWPLRPSWTVKWSRTPCAGNGIFLLSINADIIEFNGEDTEEDAQEAVEGQNGIEEKLS